MYPPGRPGGGGNNFLKVTLFKKKPQTEETFFYESSKIDFTKNYRLKFARLRF